MTQLSAYNIQRIQRLRLWSVPAPGLVFLGLTTAPPFFYALYLSMINLNVDTPHARVHFVWLENYTRILFSESGMYSILVTAGIAIAATALAIAVAATVALLIFHQAGRLSTFLTVLFLIPFTVSPVAMALMFGLILNPLFGPLPQIIALLGGPLISITSSAPGAIASIIVVEAWQWSPLAMVLLLGGLRAVPRDVVEAAAIDGAPPLQVLWKVRLPILRPVLVVASIFEFILCSQNFAAAKLLTNGGPGRATETLSLMIYNVGIANSGDVSLAAAGGIILSVIGIVATIIWLKVTKWNARYYR